MNEDRKQSANEGFEPDKFAARFATPVKCDCDEGYRDGTLCNDCEGTTER